MIEHKTHLNLDYATKYVIEHYDLNQEKHSKTTIPLSNELKNTLQNKQWNIICICGGSGTGKSSILKELFGKIDNPNFDNTKSVISNIDENNPERAAKILSGVGLSSIPTWIRKHCELSNGEQYRANMAYIISHANQGDILVIDEYTSVVDRNVAKAMSNSLNKIIHKMNLKLVVASCHFDILEWLRPDYIYDLNKGGALEKGEYLRRPKIELQVFRTIPDTWKRFEKHHYLTDEINKSAMCFCYVWNEQLVGFTSALPLPSGMFKNAYRGHRTVVLPDFQGLGIGLKISEFMAGIFKNNGKKMYCKTINPAIGEGRNNHSDMWVKTSSYGKISTPSKKGMSSKVKQRPSYCHTYIGPMISGYENLLFSAEQMRINRMNENQLSLF